MLKTHIAPPNAILLISAAVILVIALGVVAHLMTAPTVPFQPIHVQNGASNIVNPASVPAAVITTNSFYVSEQTLRNRLDDAYERHQTALVQKLSRILNGRFERRCCGFPY